LFEEKGNIGRRCGAERGSGSWDGSAAEIGTWAPA
jgi:hypothetical protein